MDGELHYVMVTDRGRVHSMGVYKSSDSAQKRADGVTGGDKVEVWTTLESDPKMAIAEYERKRL